MVYYLDKINRKILFELDRNARIPETQLAKIVGRSKESVRYRIKKLQQEEIIQEFTIWIDPVKLGYNSAKIYLTLANKPLQKKALMDFVTKDKRLFWFAIAEGAWNAGLTFFVKSNQEFFDLKNELFSQFKDLIIESRTAVLVNVNVCDKKFLSPIDSSWKTLFDQKEKYELDALEKKILKALFLNGRINVVDIARKYDTTVDMVRIRMKKLEQQKIIFRYTARLNFNKIGKEFFKTFIYFKNMTKKDEQRLMEYTRKQPEIIHLVKQISPWDMELEIMCDHYVDYNRIITDLTQEFCEIISKVETAIITEDYVFPATKMIFED
jgi:DNA-binding Lrp family transcriptional regulator